MINLFSLNQNQQVQEDIEQLKNRQNQYDLEHIFDFMNNFIMDFKAMIDKTEEYREIALEKIIQNMFKNVIEAYI